MQPGFDCTKILLMTQRKEPQFGDMPPIKPARDEVSSYKRNGNNKSTATVANTSGGGGASAVALTLLFLALIGSCGWIYYLQMQLKVADVNLQNNDARISELEQKLSITDEAMSDSAVSMQVKIRELDTEIRKLWDNVWKKSKKIHAEQDALLKKHSKSLASNTTALNKMETRLSAADKTVASLNTQLKSLERLQTRLAEQSRALLTLEAQLEKTADKANAAGSNYQQLSQRVKETEGWIESINGFRRQVNQEISTVKTQLGQLQGGRAPAQ